MNRTASPANSGVRPTSLRTFFALWPDDVAREQLGALAIDVARAGGGRAIDARNLHVTLAFIGATADDRVDAARDAGAEAVNEGAPIDFAVDQIGGPRGGDLVWIAPSSLPRALVALHERLDRALEARAFAIERRPFRPHVTLARRCMRRMARTTVEPVRWRIARLTLMASTTKPEGAEYRKVATWPLDPSER